ncbi:contractile injection system tape measure protein [Kitasatospora sp. NPDC051853]|uniref:contractile injection system tape measure protein n=1 Tax=Kitasatospora sp. NPDC051853 TaxID=3364058 RepID=UPI003789312A
MEPVPVTSAGLVLVWPLIPRWLHAAGLLTKSSEDAPAGFADDADRLRAAQALDYVAWGDESDGNGSTGRRSTTSTWLVGLPSDTDAPTAEPLLADLRAQLDQQLAAALNQLIQLQFHAGQSRTGLRGVTVQDLRQLYLQRPGQVLPNDSGATVSVDLHPGDILLWGLPWPLEQVAYPWLDNPLKISWELPQLPAQA